MREEFVLDSKVQGGGLQQALIDRFLRDTQRGTAEQFATAFVLLARSLGIEARVATGFVAASATMPTSPQPATPRAHARPTPRCGPRSNSPTAGGSRSTRFRPRRRPTAHRRRPNHRCRPRPLRSHRSLRRPNRTTKHDASRRGRRPTTSTSALSTAITWVVRGTAGVAVLLLPFADRRRGRSPASSTGGGGGASAPPCPRNGSVAHGRRRPTPSSTPGSTSAASATDGEIVSDGEPLVADARRDLHRLATAGGRRDLRLTRTPRSAGRGRNAGASRRSRSRWRQCAPDGNGCGGDSACARCDRRRARPYIC